VSSLLFSKKCGKELIYDSSLEGEELLARFMPPFLNKKNNSG